MFWPSLSPLEVAREVKLTPIHTERTRNVLLQLSNARGGSAFTLGHKDDLAHSQVDLIGRAGLIPILGHELIYSLEAGLLGNANSLQNAEHRCLRVADLDAP